MKRTALFVAALASVFTLASVTISSAGTATSTLSVGTSVISNCTQMPSSISGSLTYDVFNPNWTFSYMGHNTINCTKGSFPQLSFTGGNGTNNCNGIYGGNYCRNMVDGKGDTLVYLPYLCFYPTSVNNQTPTQNGYCETMTPTNWWNNTVQPGAAGDNPSTEQTSFWYYLYAPSGQDVPVGSYNDSFTMTLNY